ncbi:N-acetylmuramoyl-L-alanine amidase AmiB precursor [Candidatus Arsenophonus lipoptenae]|uniref:N-acetylmuramoyl-L-alanine amidase n=1 Tax=Candidatus Arsenophonus lipoptenae TaxID=634113 RepID=A0A0X9VEX0_9GAMM|nr:N-acetylmuramoyl-L-alanine amidase [Candidatus Arsenophonus lipoptenae]AMA65154.1 N-acetylmuramoyl-L-alanine amidase AmiB precursor [Candidatus Arsenophonus lipoptenae]
MMTIFIINKIKQYQFYVFYLLKIIVLFSTLLLFNSPYVQAIILSNINIHNNILNAQISFYFSKGHLKYRFFILHKPERLVIDFYISNNIIRLPIKFKNNNLVKLIRTSKSPNNKYQRIVIELSQSIRTNIAVKKINNYNKIIFNLKKNVNSEIQFQKNKLKLLSIHSKYKQSPKNTRKIIVAIDAGHGGKDPGAIGQNGYLEKNITMGIARKLQNLLKRDPIFKPVMTINGDYFLSVEDRSTIARQNRADMLVSIHADAAPNNRAKGASVWVLSNQRVNSELVNWLEQHEKQSELLGGVANVLADRRKDPFFSQAVLDLQFCNSQRVGYAVAVLVLKELSKIGSIHKYNPEHASFGVLCSPDIPSILVETGFISNIFEERLLVSADYQENLAIAIHRGLHKYFSKNPLQVTLR